MNKSFLIEQLLAIKDTKRENRLKVAHLILKNKSLFPILLNLAFSVEQKIAVKAAWVLEFVCSEKLNWLVPHLTYFTYNLHIVKFDSAIRPISKVCESLAKEYTSKEITTIQPEIMQKHLEKMIEIGFDWLIGTQKVAVKVHAMELLFLFGKTENWVHPELQLIIQQNIVNESAAYKAGGKKILSRINTK